MNQGVPTVRRSRRFVTLLSVTVLISAVLSAPALAGGVPVYNAKVCGDKWVTIRTPRSYFHVYNDDFGGYTCINAMRHRLDFAVTTARGTGSAR